MGGGEAPSSPLAAKADPARGGEIQGESQSLQTLGAEPRHWPAGEDGARHPDEQAGALLIKALVTDKLPAAQWVWWEAWG